MSGSGAGDAKRRELTRREMLGLVGAAGVAGAISTPGRASAAYRGTEFLSCVVRPEQTEGPYFVDEVLERSDIRVDPSDGAQSEGARFDLRIGVHRVDGDACAPLPGARVDLWQCDALGAYSDVRDTGGLFDTRGRKFLRGHQATDVGGNASFTTVYPGWYRGRAVHIHFKIRVPADGRRAYEFTSQLYFDEALTDAVHALDPYATKGRRDTPNARDGIFRQGGSGDQLMLAVTKTDGGYAAGFDVGLRLG